MQPAPPPADCPRTCDQPGCDNKHYAKGRCHTHYYQDRRKTRYQTDPQFAERQRARLRAKAQRYRDRRRDRQRADQDRSGTTPELNGDTGSQKPDPNGPEHG